MTRGDAIRSAVPVALFLAVLLLQTWAYFHWQQQLWTSSSSNPGAEPPWYFIGNDLLDAVVAAGALAIVLLVSFVCVRVPAYARFARMVAWQAVLWNAYKVLWGVVILAHTTSVWDESRASTTWKTFPGYLHDPLRQWTFWCGMALALPFLLADIRWGRRQ